MLATYMDGLAPQISDSEAVLWELKIEFKAKFGKLPQCRPDEPLSEFQGRIRTVLRDIDPTGLSATLRENVRWKGQAQAKVGPFSKR